MTTVNIFEKRKLRNYVNSLTLSNFDRFYRVDYQKRTVTVKVPENLFVEDSLVFFGILLTDVNVVIPKGWTLDVVQNQTANISQIINQGEEGGVASLGLFGNSTLLNQGNISANQVITITNVNQVTTLPPDFGGLSLVVIAIEEDTPTESNLTNQGVITTQGKIILGKNTSQLDSKKKLFSDPILLLENISGVLNNQGILAIFVPEYPGYSQAELNTVLTDSDVRGLLYVYGVLNLINNSGTVLIIPPIRLDPCRCQLQILPHLYFLDVDLPLNSGSIGSIISYASGLIESDTTKPQIKIPRGWNQVVTLEIDGPSGSLNFLLPANVTNSALAFQYQFQQQIRQVPCCYWDIQAIRRLANRYQYFLGNTTPIPNPGPQPLDNNNNSNRQLTRRLTGRTARRLQDKPQGEKEEDNNDKTLDIPEQETRETQEAEE
jgi:hypothetical protein